MRSCPDTDIDPKNQTHFTLFSDFSNTKEFTTSVQSKRCPRHAGENRKRRSHLTVRPTCTLICHENGGFLTGPSGRSNALSAKTL